LVNRKTKESEEINIAELAEKLKRLIVLTDWDRLSELFRSYSLFFISSSLINEENSLKVSEQLITNNEQLMGVSESICV
jgi:5S rRNA maturation endonuclease (ribonuclease M5)